MSKMCISCFNEIESNSLRELLENNPVLCKECISKIKTKLSFERIDGCNILFLGEYDGMIKSWLMNFKEYGDIELAKAFLYVYLPLIKLLYHGYIFVPCPSSDERNNKRGFIHLEEILKAYNLPYWLALSKKSSFERKNLKALGRISSKDEITLNDKAKEIENKKIVIFDDVYTTGFTFKSSLNALKKANPKRIRGLILMNANKSL